jgi:two-component system, NtrC family, sensor kinase
MPKKLIFISLLLMTGAQLLSQATGENIINQLETASNDYSRILALDKVSAFYRERDRDSAIKYIQNGIAICEKNNQLLMKLKFKNLYANQFLGKQQFAPGYALLRSILEEAEQISAKNSSWLFYPDKPLKINIYSLLSTVHYNLQILMQQTSNWEECAYHLELSKQYAEPLPTTERNMRFSQVVSGLGYSYLRQEKLDSALIVLLSGERNPDFSETIKPFLHMVIGSVYAEQKNYQKSKEYLKESMFHSTSRNTTTRSALKMSQIYQLTNQKDSAYYFARMLLDTLKTFGSANYEVDLGLVYKNLYLCFKLLQKEDSAYKYAQLVLNTSDSLSSRRIQNLKEFQQLSFAEQKRLEAIEAERKNKTVRWIAYGSIVFAALVGLIAIILFRNARQRKKTNSILLKQKQALEQTLEKLQSTQAQLIQSEKMASLGELTAGIAHEIQNPLNFVNNFSEVSAELVDEMKSEIKKGNYDEVNVIADDVKQNLEKINHHGQRAADIVKGMLQHSRSSSGVKEPTDINALADEYVRLAYHGLRAKDKLFNATMKTDFDETIGNINIIPQDIGRVILNLITNAFYAVNEKSKQGIADYEPTVSVSTKKE